MRNLPVGPIIISVAITLLANSGCAFAPMQSSSAKWAMDDERYAHEHDEPERSDPKERNAQQRWDASDARFQEGNSGVYIGGGSTAQAFPAAIGSVGMFKLPTSWSTARAGIFGMDDGGIGVGGVEGGIRLHAPTRFTPYVGLQGNAGISGLSSGHARRQTNYGQQQQTVTKLAGIAAIVPEAGVSYWLNSSTRMNVGASYYVASNQPDFLLFGVSLEFLLESADVPVSNAPLRRTSSLPSLTNECDGQLSHRNELNEASPSVRPAVSTDAWRNRSMEEIVGRPVELPECIIEIKHPKPPESDLPKLLSTRSELFQSNASASSNETDRLDPFREVTRSDPGILDSTRPESRIDLDALKPRTLVTPLVDGSAQSSCPEDPCSFMLPTMR